MATYDVHLTGGTVDRLTVHDPPLTYRCERQGRLVHVTRVNEQTGDELPSIDLTPYEFPEPIRKMFEKKLYENSR